MEFTPLTFNPGRSSPTCPPGTNRFEALRGTAKHFGFPADQAAFTKFIPRWLCPKARSKPARVVSSRAITRVSITQTATFGTGPWNGENLQNPNPQTLMVSFDSP